jgi:hypothetical protein
LWYLKRKIEYGDWRALDRKTLKKYLPKLKINPYLKEILKDFLRKNAKNNWILKEHIEKIGNLFEEKD